MTTHATWKPHTEHGTCHPQLERPRGPARQRLRIPQAARQSPLTDASHVKNALARFDHVERVSDDEHDQAFANIRMAARHYGIDVEESSWRDLGKKPHTRNPSH